MADDPKRVIEFWRAVEIFSPQPLPRPDAGNRVVDLGLGELMPWEPASQRYQPPRENKTWRHEVYGGVFELGRVRDTLVDLYGDDDADGGQKEPVRGQSAMFACTIDADGRLAEGTAVLSACAWAIGRATADPGRLSLTGFDQDAQHYGDSLGRLAGASTGVAFRLLAKSMRAIPDVLAEGVKAAAASALAPVGGPLAAAGAAAAGSAAGKIAGAVVNRASSSATTDAHEEPTRLDLNPLRGSDLQRFVAQLSTRLGVRDSLGPRGIRVRSYEIDTRRAGDEAEQSFLNSFYADDLARVARAAVTGDIGVALAGYLTGSTQIGAGERTDVRTDPGAVLRGCQPDRIPPGRWVTDLDRSLALSQQFAVCEIMDRLGDASGLLAVNGPPGTGKTTMLRDLIAAIVVARADRLAQLASPAAAFDHSRSYRWPRGEKPRTITPLDPRLTGMEIVVASSNNGAVENVTTEIPGAEGIGAQWVAAAERVDYFTSTARLVHGEGAWAMVAARLGNAANRRAFADSFWWGAPGRKDGCMVDLLERLGEQPGDWEAAKMSFLAAREKVKKLSAERMDVAVALTRVPVLRQDAASTTTVIADADAELVSLQGALEDAEKRLRVAAQRHQDAARVRDDHIRVKPGIVVSLSTKFRAGREWYARQRVLDGELEDARQNLDAARLAASAAGNEIAAARRVRTDAIGQQRRLLSELKAAQETISRARQDWGNHVPDGPEMVAGTADPEVTASRERTAVWTDGEFAAARTELFLAALALHKALIRAEATRIKQNLGALVEILKGRGRPADRAILAAWQTFFLVVPVVSTTFASVPTMFSGLRRESLGWLLIDEAGQAPPQQAVGAIWRVKRTVVVGDPLQIEPVVTLPWGGQQALLQVLGLDPEWAPEFTSAQRVADRLARYGTWLPGSPRDDSGPVWVGMPLRVHRRCDHPMFDVSNEIAYAGLMVYGTSERAPFPGRNIWYDIRSQDARGHWIPAEGDRLQGLLGQLRDSGTPVSGIRVISPFRQVASEAARVHREVFGEACSAEDRKKWVGTVHTMQGKEADVVILILGGDPAKPGSRTFAIQAPNLLNVAVTRARRRLYVIGDQSTWGTESYFSVLARHMQAWRPHSHE